MLTLARMTQFFQPPKQWFTRCSLMLEELTRLKNFGLNMSL